MSNCRLGESFDRLCKLLPIPVFLEDLEGNIRCANTMASQIYGYEVDTFTTLKVYDLVPERFHNSVDEFVARLRVDKRGTFETWNVTKDKCEFPVRVTASMFDGEWYFVLVEDLRELKSAEGNYNTVVQNMFDGYWKYDLEGRILDVNSKYCELVGYTRQELLNMYIWDVEANEDKSEVKQHIQGILATGGMDKFKTRHRKKDGGVIELEVTTRFSKETHTGHTFLKDITEEEMLRRELEATSFQHEKMLELFDMASNKSGKPMIITTENFEILFANGFAAQLLGQKGKDLVGDDALTLLGLEEEYEEIRATLEQTHYYERIVGTHGRAMYVRVRALYNTIVKGYAFYPASYDLMNDLSKLQKMGYIND